MRHVILCEPFNCGSHAQLLTFIANNLADCARITTCVLPGKKWHWRMRAGSWWASTAIPHVAAAEATQTTLFCSSMLNLPELLALRSDLHAVRKVIYFHENQLAYPQRRAAGAPASRTAAAGAAGSSSAAAAAAAPELVMGTLADQVASAAAPEGDRDFHFGWVQVLTAVAADVVAWNSCFNRDSFLEAIPQLLGLIPDKAQRPPAAELQARIRAKSVVAYFPVQLPPTPPAASSSAGSGAGRELAAGSSAERHTSDAAAGACRLDDPAVAASAAAAVTSAAAPMLTDGCPSEHSSSRHATASSAGTTEGAAVAAAAVPLPASISISISPSTSPFPPVAPLVIAWNHRWEYDKQPEVLFETLRSLHEAVADFRLVLLGEAFAEAPPSFAAARPWLEAAGKVAHWGYAPSKAQYWALLRASDVVLSTAAHEFFGVAVVEGVLAGCYPLCPGALAYPEIIAPSQAELAAAAAAATSSASAADAGATAHAASVGGSAASSASAAGGAGAAAVPAAGSAPPKRREPPPHERIDCRGSQHLFRSPADLRKKLLYLARRPDIARAWKAAWSSRIGSGIGSRDADADADTAGASAVEGGGSAAAVSASSACASSLSAASVGAAAGAGEPSAGASSANSSARDAAFTPASRSALALPATPISAAAACPDASFRFDRFAAPNLVPVYRSLLGIGVEGAGR